MHHQVTISVPTVRNEVTNMLNKLTNVAQVTLMVAPAIAGYWFTYMAMWLVRGLPLETWSLLTLLGLAGFTEASYIKWIMKESDKE